MSGSSSEWSQLKEARNPIHNLVESLLSRISHIIISVTCIQVESEIFTEIGCYFYRVSAVITELRINRNTPTNTVEILQTLSERVDTANNLSRKLEKNSHKMHSSEFRTILHQLESVVRSIGENLGLIPISTYGNQEYAEKAAKSLSNDMKDYIAGHKVETDLYSVDADENQESYSVNDDEDQECLKVFDQNSLSDGSTSMGFPHRAHYMEPLYETFLCPLTKRVMDDPVTIESGMTYERKAIEEWFEKLESVCPKSRKNLKNRNLSTNVALKATIDEWRERNETARIKVARAALSLASSDDMVLEAIADLRDVCMDKLYNKIQVRGVGIVPLLARFLEYKSRRVRCVTLELLRQLAEDDDEGKNIIAKALDISTVVNMLSSSHAPIRHASALLLLELSKSQILCDNIGMVAGGVLMLITAKFRQSHDAFVSEIADEILKNLEMLPENIKLMAENGYWKPLLTHLVEGNDDTKTKMAIYLGETVLGPDTKTYVAEKASPPLIHMVHGSNPSTRTAAFKALKQISSHHQNAKALVEAGIMQTTGHEIFTRTKTTTHDESKAEAAAILANILESDLDVEHVHVSRNGHTISSDYIIYSIVAKIKNTTPDELNINLIRILIKLLKSSSTIIISLIKETEASYDLIELINTPDEELGILSIKLLIMLSDFMGHTLSDRLCKTKGQPESLIRDPITKITEKHAVSATFLAKLPHQNLQLNLSLVNSDIISRVVKTIGHIQTCRTRSSRQTNSYFEGLVGILVRLTTTLYDHQIFFTARNYKFVSVFTELLTKSSTDEVQKLSAVGLENLSRQTMTLSRIPQGKKTKVLKVVFFNKRVSVNLPSGEKGLITLCPVHGGVCEANDTFCLVSAGEALERLIECLDHESVEVIEAALSALSTLLDDRVNVDESIKLLSIKDVIRHVLTALKEHEGEVLRRKAFWVIERFLINGGDDAESCSRLLLEDRLFTAVLVSAFHHGVDDRTRKMAANILRRLNKMPDLYSTMTTVTM